MKRASRLWPWLLWMLAASASPSLADEGRMDHRGSLGLLLGVGGEMKSGVATGNLRSDSGSKLLLDLGGTWAFDYDGNELLLLARAGLGATAPEAGLIAGYRGYFGKEQMKTFFDLDVSAQWVPGLMFTLGPRVGAGLQYEVLNVLGIYGAIAAQAGFGGGLRFSAELIFGVQLRTYVLE